MPHRGMGYQPMFSSVELLEIQDSQTRADSTCRVPTDAPASPLRVLHLYAGNLFGGIERMLVTIARESAAGGGAGGGSAGRTTGNGAGGAMQSHFGLCFDGRLARELRACGAVVHDLGAARFSRPWTVRAARRRVRELLRVERFDAAICHSNWPHALFGPVCRSERVPLVQWVHDVPGGRHWTERLARLTRPDAAIANSAFTASKLPALFGGAVPRSLIHPPVPDMRQRTARLDRAAVRAGYGAADSDIVIVCASRLEAGKGHDVLIDALGRLPADLPWRCLISAVQQRPGDAEILADLEARVHRLDLAGRVRLLRDVPDVAALFAAADLYCQPNTRAEGFGISFVEAMYCGLPVVTSRIGGGAEVVDATCGILTVPHDALAVSDAIERLARDGELRSRLGRAGQRRAARLCDPQQVLERLHVALSRAAADARGARDTCAASSVNAAPIVLAEPAANLGRAARRPWLLVTGDFVKTGGMDRANHALTSHLARRGEAVHLVAFRADAELLALPNVVLHRVVKPLRSYTLALPLLARAARRWARRLTAPPSRATSANGEKWGQTPIISARGIEARGIEARGSAGADGENRGQTPISSAGAPCGGAGARVIVNGGAARWGDVNWVHYVHAAHRPRFDSPARRIVGALNHHRWLRDERRAIGAARIVLANSHRTRRDIVERLGVPADRVHVVYYGVDPHRFRPAFDQERTALRERLGLPLDRRIVLFVGALSDRRKGFDTLWRAWHRAAINAMLCVIGAGSEVARWHRRARSASLENSIRFTGHRDDVADWMRAADLLVSPTRYEPYGLAVHEALCCGIPAIVSADAGVAERFPDSLRHLLLRDPNDADELAAQLRRWEQAPCSATQRAELSSLSESLRRWTWYDMAARMVELIEAAGLCRDAPNEAWTRAAADDLARLDAHGQEAR